MLKPHIAARRQALPLERFGARPQGVKSQLSGMARNW